MSEERNSTAAQPAVNSNELLDRRTSPEREAEKLTGQVTVRELIAFLEKQSPDAVITTWDSYQDDLTTHIVVEKEWDTDRWNAVRIGYA